MSNSIGSNIYKLRKEIGLTQTQMAEYLNVSFQTVSKWERGLCFPDITLLPGLAELLGTSVDALLGHTPGELRRTMYYDLYKDDRYYWGTDPTPLCYRILEKYPPVRHLRLLEIGCGEGRDAVFFARNGYEVSAYDITADGIRKAQQLAAIHHVPLTAFTADMVTFRPSEEYDIVYASRSLHYLPPKHRAEFFAAYKDKTRPGGLHAFMVMLEKPSIPAPPEQEQEKPVYLMRSGEIFTYYHDWDFLTFEETVIDCNSSGVMHQHCVNIMLAVKP